ncbi:MAG: hypothetical protein FWD73_11250 [Polyangiaceae bacterium]|nr:hypothetical protein [Polyangiaceae bacterium]
MRKDAPLSVDVPLADRDNPGWVKVGAIAAIGFAIGIAWPKVTGFRLGPSPPGESAASLAAKAAAEPSPEAPAPSASATPQAVSSALKAASATPAASALPTPAASSAPAMNSPASPALLQVAVQKVSVLSCKTDNGEVMKGKECGAITALDELVRPKLRELGSCSAAGGQAGKISFLATADFANGRLLWNLGKSTKLNSLESVDGVAACLKTIFQGTNLRGVAHEHARYTVAYSVSIAPAGDAKPSAGSAGDNSANNSNGARAAEAVVTWEVALVRDAPKTGAVVARLPRGTKVEVGAAQEGWYAVKFGDGFASDGWVHRGAIGK